MEKHATFGNTDLAKKIASQFCTTQETIKVEKRYTGSPGLSAQD